MRGRVVSIVVLTLGLTALMPLSPGDAAFTLPLGFTDQFLFKIEQPTAIAFTPDRRMLITSRPGRLFVATNGVVFGTPALDLRSRICYNSERGLVGVAVDPDFATNHFIYLFYTFKKFTDCPTNNVTQPVNRVSRFVLPDSNAIMQNSEVVLLDNIPSVHGIHNAGDLNFGSDGKLYVTIGDGGCGNATGQGCTGPGALNGLLGKVARINQDGTAPTDNPYQGSGTLPCALTGSVAAHQTCREIYARGLRNPFRFAMDPNTPGQFYINDVGSNVWEEIDRGLKGAHYGWPTREGHGAQGSVTNCGPPPAGMMNPIFDYNHSTGCKSIVGGAFVPNDSGWPDSYLGQYLFADFICGTIFRLEQNGSGYEMTPFSTDHAIGSLVHLEFGPAEPRRALYYTTFESGGEVRRIAFTSTGNPVAEMTASPITGLAPLTVDFDGSASGDPEEEPITYLWEFGDGATDETTTPLTSHTYTVNGDYTATLVVRDPGGLESAPFPVEILVGNEAPVPVITSPASGSKFRVGQTLTLTGSATDREDGTLPSSALVWRVWRFHRDHRHPYFGPTTGNGLTITGPVPEDLTAATNSYLIVELTVTDSKGISTTASRIVQPLKVGLTFRTKPATNLNVLVVGQTFKCPVTVVSWAGWQITIKAPAKQGEYKFVKWSDAGLAEHVITTPDTPTTYTATYVSTAV